MSRNSCKPSVCESVRRSLVRHIERSLDYSHCGRRVSDEAIHAMRKELKCARAALRLLREPLGQATYRREKETLRTAGHALAHARDTKVLLDRCHALARRAGASPPAALPHRLRLERARARRDLLGRTGALAKPSTALEALAQRSARWSLRDSPQCIVRRAIKRTYSRGRRALAASRADRSVATLHAWRKEAQYLWHQLELLEELGMTSARGPLRAAHRLSQWLGEDHDLALLGAKMRVEAQHERHAKPPSSGTSPVDQPSRHADVFLEKIDARRVSLQRKAFEAGDRLYRRKPRAFARRITADV